MSADSKSRYAKIRRRKIALFVFLGLFVCLEVALHILFPDPDPTYYFTIEKASWAEDPELFWKPVDNFKPQIKQIKKTPAEDLIYLFGGSIPTAHYAQTNFPAELQKMLGHEKEVVNFATGGYSSLQSLVLFKRMLEIKTPSIVIVCHATNDRDIRQFSDQEWLLANQEFSKRVMHVLCKLKSVALLRGRIRKMRDYNPYTLRPGIKFKARVNPAEFRENMLEFAAIAKQKDIQLVFLTQGSIDMDNYLLIVPYFEQMRKVAGNKPYVHFLDVRQDIFAAYLRKTEPVQPNYNEKVDHSLMVDTCHLTNEGHRLVAELLYDFLVKEKLVPGDPPGNKN